MPRHKFSVAIFVSLVFSLNRSANGRLVLQAPLEDRAEKIKFGQTTCVSDDGRRVFIGANGYDRFKGALYVYDLASGSGGRMEHWRRTRLTGNETKPAEERKPRELRAVPRGSGFGFSCAVSTSANHVLVGAPGHDMQRGAVYIFAADPETRSWREAQKLSLEGARNGDSFGWTISLSDDCGQVAVSAKGRRANNGEVSIFSCNGQCEECSFVQSISPPDYTDSVGPRGIRIRNNFGVSMAMNGAGTVLAVGCTGFEGEQGAVYIFSRSGVGNWTMRQRLQSPNAQKFGFFGFKVSMDRDGRMLIVGADGEDDYKGAAYLFHEKASTNDEVHFVELQELRSSQRMAEDNFGGSVALSGNGRALLIGAPGANVGDGRDHGVMYLYEEVSGHRDSEWKLSDTLKLPSKHSQPANFYGWAVSLSADGRRFVATAPDSNSGSGLATIGEFRINGRRPLDSASLANDDVVDLEKEDL